MRQWKFCPQDIELPTPVGTVCLTVTGRDHIVVDARGRRNYLTVRGKTYSAYFHLFDSGDGFEPPPDVEVYIRRVNNALPASIFAQEQVLQAVVPEVNQWAKDNPHVLEEAQASHVNNGILSLENRIAGWVAQVRRARRQIEELRASLKTDKATAPRMGLPKNHSMTRGEGSPAAEETCLYCGIPLEIEPSDENLGEPPVCVMCTDPGDFLQPEDSAAANPVKPKVLIEVGEGVADYRALGDVEVCVVDYDVLQSGGECDIPEDFFEAFPGLREAVSPSKNRE